MTIQELEHEIMALSGRERAELLTRLERRALYDNRNAAMVVVSNDLSEEGAEKPVAEVYRFQMGRQKPHQTIDIFAEIFQDATSVSKPLINAFIRRWELIVRNKHRFSDKFSRFAIRHLEHVGQVMAEGAKQRATPIEHVIAEDIHQDEFYYLNHVHDILRDRKIKRIKSWKTKCNLIEKRLREKSIEVLSEIERRYDDNLNSPLSSRLSESARFKAKASGLKEHRNHHHRVVDGILKFLSSDLCPSSNREERMAKCLYRLASRSCNCNRQRIFIETEEGC